MEREKRKIVELSVVVVTRVELVDGEAVGDYLLTDAARTIERRGQVRVSLTEKMSIAELYAALVLAVETQEGLQ